MWTRWHRSGSTGGSEHRAAFTQYERLLRSVVEKSQAFASSAGRFLAPPTERKIHRRNCTYRVLASRALNGLIGWLSTRHARTETLADYPLPEACVHGDAEPAGRRGPGWRSGSGR